MGFVSYFIGLPAKILIYLLDVCNVLGAIKHANSHDMQKTLASLFSSETHTATFNIKTRIFNAASLVEWKELNDKLDQMEGKTAWKLNDQSRKYDYKLIRTRLSNLKTVSENESVSSMMFLLRAGLIRNLGGIGKAELYVRSNVGTKNLIERYIDEVVQQIDRIAWSQEEEITTSMKIDYLSDVLQSFGRTVLVFHGGASFGLSHLGVAKALHDANMLPKIICGSYIGALVAGLICAKTGAELEDVFAGDINITCFGSCDLNGSLRRKLVRLLKHGRLFDIKVIEECARDNIGDITFKEAFVKTGRILNIIVHAKRKHEVPVLLNYLTAPDVVIWSAASASCAVPGIYDAVTLLVKDSKGETVPWNPSAVRLSSARIVDEIPVARLSELFNANNFIVSHVPSYFSFRMTDEGLCMPLNFLSSIARWLLHEIQHRLYQLKEIGLIPATLLRLEQVISAPDVGDIQISPTIWTSDLSYVFANPTRQFITECIRKGQHACWRKISQIEIRCAIEFELDRMIQALKLHRSRSERSMKREREREREFKTREEVK